ncbi:phospholipase D family protein [Primorskyibacter marinus]|uniref:phospholipase D family protein n=1 Tax=Primorskyibacter marinus TaxID=1977320 RepID=UPI000E3007ED|nr:phospholipase D family protein [Primorskyibacter marinus]
MIYMIKLLVSLLVFVGVVVLIARMVFTVPTVEDRTDTTALKPAVDGPLADALIEREAANAGLTGVAPLQNGADAFAARMILADAAVSSIDAQYYIWHGDLTGTLLLDALVRAADRGVRVRLLLDDNGTGGLDPELAKMNAHPMIEVRLWNPFNLRHFKLLSYGFDFFRLNRRMHNKSFTVDGRATVLGGRNIGDEYFSTGSTALYVDLDVLAVGAIVPEVSADFDKYWAAPSTHPVGPIVGAPQDADPVADRLASYQADPQMAEYRALLKSSDIVAALAAGEMGVEWTNSMLVSDDPVKGEGAVPREDLLASRLRKAVGEIESSFDGISPYFVPGKAGVNAFATLARHGVVVRMLTNSLEATDVLPVHAGYAKHREDMLKAGVVLYELRQQAAVDAPIDRLGPFGSSGASLHAKTFAVDGKRIFVGSFNFDPRSTTLNTEMGLLIDSELLAQGLHGAFDNDLRGLAWRVERKDNDLVWIDPEDGSTVTDEPGTTFLKRAALTVIGWLPIEWLL